MGTGSGGPIGVSPFHSRGALKGFVISGRWPDSTKEWAQLLMVAVRVASLPGLLSTTTVFGAREELPDEPEPGTVGLVLAEGTVFGESAIQPGYFADHQPPALLMLHPPSETTPSLPECTGAASGCVLLPGLPYLGLEHRAAWVEAEADGHHHIYGEPGGRRPDKPSRHRNSGNAACSIRKFEGVCSGGESPNTGGRTCPTSWCTPNMTASLGTLAKGSSPESSSRHTGEKPGWRTV